MTQHPNLDVISRFFEAYQRRDLAALRQVTTDDVSWRFPGRNPLSGTRQGVEDVVAFFDRMGGFGFRPEKWITGANDSYVVEAQRVRVEHEGSEIAMDWCVLWSFADGKLAGGVHFSADQHWADEFFNKVAGPAPESQP